MGAVIKKIALALLTDKKILKLLGGIVLGVLILVFMPIAVMLSVFSGNFDFDNAAFEQTMQAQLTSSQHENFAEMEQTLLDIAEQMKAKGHEQRTKQAQWLYLSALTKQAQQDGFVGKLVGCFADEQSDEELLEAVKTAFGVTVDLVEFRRLMEITVESVVESQDEH